MRQRLTAKFVEKLNVPGHYADGGGLYLQVQIRADTSIAKSWVVRFRSAGGRLREMGIGTAEYITLAEARSRAFQARQKAALGIDPIEERKAERVAARAKESGAMTFKACAEAYIEAHRKTWKSEKHGAQWSSTLATYAYPVIGQHPVASIDQAPVLKVLDPIWPTKTETATRVRSRMENILDWAKVRGYRQGDNPARWRGHLDKALPARRKVKKIAHHAAMPYADLPAFFRDLVAVETAGSRAFAFCILTATRTSETLLAEWSEFDLEQGIWTVPAERMKAGREHRVPLSKAALDILGQAKKQMSSQRCKFVFESPTRENVALSNMTFLMHLRRVGLGSLTGHGFRSTFRDWASEETEYSGEVAEAALAHTVSNKVEAAYRRGDLFEKRRALMEAWAQFALSAG